MSASIHQRLEAAQPQTLWQTARRLTMVRCMVKLVLVRHPAVDVPEGLCYGRSDVALVAEWEPWAADVARFVQSLPEPVTCVSSPLTRCLAPAAALGVDVRSDGRLTEIDFGRWEGMAWRDVPRAEVAAWNADIANVAPGGGETVASMYARCAALVADLRRDGSGSAVLVTHSGPIRCLLANALGLGPEGVLSVQVDFGALSSIRLSQQRDVLEFSNRTPPIV